MAAPDFSFSSASEEWYTPADIIERVRVTLGGEIELDPASCALANEVVRAERYYSWHEQHEDGLTLPWQCVTLFCNPPYGRRTRWIDQQPSGLAPPYGANQELWLNKFFNETDVRVAGAGILLCNAGIGDLWFSRVWERATAVCLLHKRVAFDTRSPGGAVRVTGPQPTKGNALILAGGSSDLAPLTRFHRAFEEIGHVIEC